MKGVVFRLLLDRRDVPMGTRILRALLSVALFFVVLDVILGRLAR